MDEKDEKSSLGKHIERSKKQLEIYLKINEIIKKGTISSEGKKEVEEEIERLKKEIETMDLMLTLDREGRLEEVMALKRVLYILGKESDKLKSILETQKLILSDIEEVKKKGKKAKKIYGLNKKFEKEQKEYTVLVERMYLEALEKEADPEWVKKDFERKWKSLGLDD